MTKKDLSERDICTKYITPAIKKACWNIQTQVREDVYFTDGRIFVKGNLSVRGKAKRADYILYYKPNIPIAIIEAKDNKHSVRAGIQQGLAYAEILDIPLVYSSNGDGFYEHDRTCTNGKIEQELALDQFPSPQTLWQRYKKYKGIEKIEDMKILQVNPLNHLGSPVEIVGLFGSRMGYLQALIELEYENYKKA